MVIKIIIAVVVIFFVVNKFRRNKSLSLQQLDLTPDEETKFYIRGRRAGVWGWILNLLNIETDYQLIVMADNVSFVGKSIFGESILFMPLMKISHTSYGYSRPLIRVLVGFFVIVVGVLFSFDENYFSYMFPVFFNFLRFFLIIVGIGIIVSYFFNKEMYVLISNDEGTKIELSFKRSVIENVDVNIEKVKESIGVLNELVLNKNN